MPQLTYQDIYDFWLKHSINSTNNLEKNSQKQFLQQFKRIIDSNIMEDEFLSKMAQKQRTLQIKWYMLNQYEFAKVIQL